MCDQHGQYQTSVLKCTAMYRYMTCLVYQNVNLSVFGLVRIYMF